MTKNHEFIKVWKNEYKVHSYEADYKGNATMQILCQFMQESAWNHAEHLQVGFSHLIEQNLIWVLSRQAVKILTYPKWGDTIKIHTWPSGKDRIFCYRDFKIFDDKDNVIGLASTTWFVIDLVKRRPQRTDSYITLNVDEDVERALPVFPPKLESLEPANKSGSFQVTYSDLDVNEHVKTSKHGISAIESQSEPGKRWYRTLPCQNNLGKNNVDESHFVCYKNKEVKDDIQEKSNTVDCIINHYYRFHSDGAN